MNDTWDEAVDAFTTAMRAARRSPGTIRLYRKYVHDLTRRFNDPWTVTTADLRAWLAERADWKPETAKSARTAVRAFYKWAHDDDRVDVDPSARLAPVRIPRSLPRPAPATVATAATTHTDERVRHMAMLAAYAGLRCTEIARIHADNVTTDHNNDVTLRVTGKGDTIRDIPIVHEPLAAWLRTLEGYAFPSVTANGIVRPHLSAGHVTRLLAHALPGAWTAHTLRHYFATAAYAGTRDLRAVQELLGHSKPETTARYTLVPTTALRAAVATIRL